MGKKKSHFLSDVKASESTIIRPNLYLISAGLCLLNHYISLGNWSGGGKGTNVKPSLLRIKYNNNLQVYVFNPKLGITFSETSNITELDQAKQSNQKYTGAGYIP